MIVPLRGPVRVALTPLAWLLAAVGAAVRRPSLVVVGTVLLICLPSQITDVSASGHVTPADVAACAVVAVIAIRLLAGERSTARRGWLPFAAVLVALVLATVTADDVALSLVGFVRYAELFVAVPVAVAMSLRDRLDVLLVAAALISVTLAQGAIGVYQYLTGTGATYGGQYVRAVGTFGPDQVLALGTLLGYGLVVTLALGLARRGRYRVALLSAAAFLVVPLGLTLSRGAWIASAGAVLIVLVIAAWRAVVALAGVAALAGAFLLLGSAGAAQQEGRIDQRVTSIVSAGSEPDQSVEDRYALWHTAIAIWRAHPVAGVGLKDFAHYRDSYASIGLSAGSDVGDKASGISREPLLSAHNQYLMVLSEQGTAGILAFGVLLGSLAAGAVRGGPARRPAEQRFLDLAAPGLVVWTLIDFAYGDVGAGPTSVLLAVVLGLIARRSLIIPGAKAPLS